MPEEIVDQDTNLEGEEDTNSQDGSEELTKAQEAYESQKIRAEKAEKELKALKANAEKVTPKNDGKKEKSDGSDYDKVLKTSQQALLTSMGFKNPEQQEYVFNQVEKYKVDISEVLNDEFHQSKLKGILDKADVADSMPKGGGKGGGNTSDSVDYWVNKGEMPEDQELAEKVIDAKLKKEKSKSTFSDTLYVD